MAAQKLLLSRGKLETFLACQRRFQLRYLAQLPWPEAPLTAEEAARLQRGQQFHQLLQRHFLGLTVESASLADPDLRAWWRAFRQQPPPLPHGRLLPELTLTVPIGDHLLHGRFDLLILGEEAGAPRAYLFDWKTGQPQPAASLRREWQTRLYLAMLAESGGSLWPPGSGELKPGNITLTYWYAAAPEASVSITYDSVWHQQNWGELQAWAARLETQLTDEEAWPLTPDWSLCRRCAYQAFCGRQTAGPAVAAPVEDEAEESAGWFLEPDLPG